MRTPAELAKELPSIACKTYKDNHPFHQVLNSHAPQSGKVWDDLADYIVNLLSEERQHQAKLEAQLSKCNVYQNHYRHRVGELEQQLAQLQEENARLKNLTGRTS